MLRFSRTFSIFKDDVIIKFIRKLFNQTQATRRQSAHSPVSARAIQRKKNKAHAPAVLSAKVHRINPTLISPNAIRVTATLQQAGYHAFIVGGAVRDLLLDTEPKDFDVATDATPEQIQRLFRRARIIGRRFQIVHVQFGKEIIEVSTFRALVDAPADLPQEHKPNAPLPRHLRRIELDRHPHAVDASGRVLRDNVWGAQHEDVARRDFTINAMYYDPAKQTVLDYHNGMADMRARLLRMIGDPATRYREDPVRMLRVVRFAAKLDFEIEASTRAPLSQLSALISNVPAARLFDETLKLLLSGYALACLQKLRAEGLHHGILPLLDVVFDESQHEKFITLALKQTDERVRVGKPVSAGFLFAALLWHDVHQRWQTYTNAGHYPIPALYQAMDDALNKQTLALQRRYIGDMKEIWGLQPRLEKRGRHAFKLLEHPRFRAAYDFLVLRGEAGEIEMKLVHWWNDFIAGTANERDALIEASHKDQQPSRRRKKRSRNSSAAKKQGGEQTHNEIDGADTAPAPLTPPLS